MEKENRRIILTLGSFSFITSLSGASVNLALPKMATDFNVPSSIVTQAVQVALMVTVIFLVMFGRAGDILSKTAVFKAGGWLFIVGTLINGISPTFTILLLGRIVQAVGSAMVMANSMGIINQYFTDSTRTQALAYNSMFVSIGSISGPAIGGMIMGILGWRWIFLLFVPISIVIVLMSARVMKSPKIKACLVEKEAKQANWTGQALFTIGIIIIFLSNWITLPVGSSFVSFLIFLVVGLIVTALSFVQDDFSKVPWIRPVVLRNGLFLMSTTVFFLMMLVNAISNILLPFYLQNFLGFKPFTSGVIVACQSLVMLLLSPIVGRLASDQLRRYRFIIAGLLVLALSQLGYATYGNSRNLFFILFPILLNGVGMALAMTPNNSMTMSLVSPADSGVTGSINSLFRTLGMAIGIQFASSFLYFLMPGVTQISSKLGNTYLHANRQVFIVAFIISIVAFVLNLLRPVKKAD
jgi:MFS family permease